MLHARSWALAREEWGRDPIRSYEEPGAAARGSTTAAFFSASPELEEKGGCRLALRSMFGAQPVGIFSRSDAETSMQVHFCSSKSCSRPPMHLPACMLAVMARFCGPGVGNPSLHKSCKKPSASLTMPLSQFTDRERKRSSTSDTEATPPSNINPLPIHHCVPRRADTRCPTLPRKPPCRPCMLVRQKRPRPSPQALPLPRTQSADTHPMAFHTPNRAGVQEWGGGASIPFPSPSRTPVTLGRRTRKVRARPTG